MDRRHFLKSSLAAVATVTVSGASMKAAWARPGMRPTLPMPSLLDLTQSGRLELVAQPGNHRFGPDRAASSTFGYNQAYLGPIVRAHQGQEIAALVRNNLPEPLATHWHGLLIPGEVDGGPHLMVNPGKMWAPILPIDQPPSTAWFHAHTHPHTARQVYSGLAGVFQISDGQDDERGLPHQHGVDDLTLVLQDRQFDDNGRLTYHLGMFERMHGFMGDEIVVNGAPNPRAGIPRSIVRLRLLNGSNARIYHLRFDDGRPMHVIASDSGYLPDAVPTKELRLSPGERIEVLVDFSDGREVSLLTGPDQNRGGSGMMGIMSSVRSFTAGLLDDDLPVLSFHPGGRKGAIDRMPEKIDNDLAPAPTHFTRKRAFSLNMMLGDRPMGRGLMGRDGTGPVMGINGRAFDMHHINEQIALGTTEHWTIESDRLMHPFHIHGVRFRVLADETGQAPRLENRGYKDTVLVDGRAEVAIEFTQPAPDEAPFMYHCHVLEHEDAGMMGHFSVS